MQTSQDKDDRNWTESETELQNLPIKAWPGKEKRFHSKPDIQSWF